MGEERLMEAAFFTASQPKFALLKPCFITCTARTMYGGTSEATLSINKKADGRSGAVVKMQHWEADTLDF